MNIYQALSKGADNAKTGKELAKQFNCDIRAIAREVEKERRAGLPICAAAQGPKTGYYIASTPEELEAYCNQLLHRGGELFKTRRALITVLEQLKQQRNQEETQQPEVSNNTQPASEA